MQARDVYRKNQNKTILMLPPPAIPKFLILGMPVEVMVTDLSEEPMEIKLW